MRSAVSFPDHSAMYGSWPHTSYHTCVGGSPHLIVLGAKLLIVLVTPEGLTAMVAIIIEGLEKTMPGTNGLHAL